MHPILPILDVGIVQNLHEPVYVSLSDLLLFWSMASVAVNVGLEPAHRASDDEDQSADKILQFVPSSVWQLEGFGSCKEMKATAYEHAKVSNI